LPLKKQRQMQKLSELEDANASKNNKKHDKNAKCNEPLIVNSCQPRKKYTTTNKSKARMMLLHATPRRKDKVKQK